jgi:hypothetical protein
MKILWFYVGQDMDPVSTPKQQAKQLLEELPDSVSWSELAYHVEVRADMAVWC